jgi:hypothetical protein
MSATFYANNYLRPAKEKDEKRLSYWLVAYLGQGASNLPAWSLAAVAINKKVVRVSFKKEKVEGGDLIPYVYWIPLGDLPRGDYTLELYDVDGKRVALSVSMPLLPRISLQSIYGTSGQEGITPLNSRVLFDKNKVQQYREPFGAALAELRAKVRRDTHVLLTRGDDVTSSINATFNVLLGGQTADLPATDNPKSTSKKFWLAVRLPDGPQGLHWLVKSVTVNEKTIRFSFSAANTGATGFIVGVHWYWVPLGELEPGAYSLELFDSDRQHVERLRGVTIGK